MAVHPFAVRISGSVIEDLKHRLAATRWTDQVQGAGWNYGIDIEYLREVVRYWHETFDWTRPRHV